MKDGTYHKKFGFPTDALIHWVGRFDLAYSEHALRAAKTDRYGEVPLYDWAEFEAIDVVEVTVENGAAVKAVLRAPLDYRDIVFVLAKIPGSKSLLVKTVWFNLHTDQHKTLNERAYVRFQS